MSLSRRILILVAGFVAMALVVMGLGLTTITDYNRMMAEYSRVSENAYNGERLNYLISNVVMESRGIYHAASPDEAQEFAGRLGDNLDMIEHLLKQWRADGTAGNDINLDLLEARTRDFVATRRELARVGVEVSPAAAEAIGIRTRSERIQFQQEIDAIVALTRDTQLAVGGQVQRYGRDRMVGFVAVTLLGIAGATALSLWLVSHFITREINRTRLAEENREKLLKELMESNTELERFAYVASHDMQEPVRMIHIYSQLVASDYAESLDEKGRTYLGIISGSATRIQTMVRDLLHYSRLRNARGEETAFELGEQVKYVRANLAQLLADTDAVVEDGVLPQVWGNPVQIQRVLENLVGNGIKYQPPGQVPHVKFSAEDHGERWMIAVQDNGIGVPAEFAAQIFEPFRRLCTWDQYQGTGLGLSICRKIVERHGGTIWVESKPGEGARFCFTLAKPPAVAHGIPVSAAA